MEEDEELKRIRERKLEQMRRKLTFSHKMKNAGEKENKSDFNKPIDITDTKFQEMIQNHPLVVVDCWAPWCGPCQMVAPILEELAREYAGRILFGKLNVDENQKIAVQYQVMSIPTLLVFKNGKLVDRIVGAMPKQILEPKITRHL